MNTDHSIQMQDQINRRVFLGGSGGGLGFAALASLMKPVIASDATVASARFAPHFPPKAKRIIYLFQSGAPSQMDLFDPKPQMEKYRAARAAILRNCSKQNEGKQLFFSN